MAHSSCLSHKPDYKYDVFLSFKGEDTRYAFTGNLYDALHQKGINTFMDEVELERGESISPAILKAIEESRISMIIFSENYASSTWCLDELVKILECMKQQNQLVFPIFYKVKPTTVRYQMNSYGEAIAKHEKRFKKEKDKVQTWKSALFEVSNLSGREFKFGYEFQFIEMIVKEISTKLNSKHLHVGDNLVGLEFHVKEANSLLDIESNKDSLMVGIYGPGGIGKTTLARVLYNMIVDQFECSCFLVDVREISNSKGLLTLQKTLLVKILGEKYVNLSNVYEGIFVIQNRLQHKRLILVLDDVDKLEQLQLLAGEYKWFGSGSRIIITTRNKHLLIAHEIEKTYQMKELNHYEALELFSWNAFKMKHPPLSHLNTSKSIVYYAKGLPLALKVIGSDLFGKTLHECESALDKYKRIPNGELQKVLRISYDSLEDSEKNIFLDIVCFFNWEALEYVKEILDACNFYPQIGIGVLVDKSLISIEGGIVRVHDLIRDMGREIIRQVSPTEPGKRSRLWFHEDVLEVLTKNTGTENIEGMMLDLPKLEIVYWSGTAFNRMKNLRILIIRNATFSIGPEYLPNNLRLFEWMGYPSKTLPLGFHPKKLVAFKLPNSCITLHRPFKEFQFLMQMKFTNCQFIIEIPDVFGIPNLQHLRLDGCTNLVKVHDSVGLLSKLITLNCSKCKKLKYFPRGIHLISLQSLILSHCRRLEFFPNILGKMEKLLMIILKGTAIKELPDSFGSLTGLISLQLGSCKYLRNLPSTLFMMPQLQNLGMGDCPQLVKSLRQVYVFCFPSFEVLSLDNCRLFEGDLRMIFICFPKLHSLSLRGSNLESLSTCITEAVNLRNLYIDDCKNLKEISEIPSNLQKISATNCTALTSESSARLWNQVFKEVHILEITMPATKIPKWFDYRNKGETVSFWIYQKFPSLAVAFVFKNLDELENQIPSQWRGFNLCARISINGIKVKNKLFLDPIVGGHVVLFFISKQEWMGLEEFLVHDWNYVEICCSNLCPELPKLTVKYCGVHVYTQETNMEDIQFYCPINLLKQPASFSSQHGGLHAEDDQGCQR